MFGYAYYAKNGFIATQCTRLLRLLYCTKFEGGLGRGQAMHIPRLCSFLFVN